MKPCHVELQGPPLSTEVPFVRLNLENWMLADHKAQTKDSHISKYMCQNALNITFNCRLSHLVYPTSLQELCFVTFVSEALTQEQLELPQVIVEVLFHVFEPEKLKVLRVFVPIRPVVLNKASIH